TYGHSIGDIVLKQIGNTCLQTLRDFDLFGRIGGEEFAVLLVESNREQADSVAQRLLNAIKNQEVEDGLSTIKTTASIGMSMLSPEDKHFEELLQRADQAMYQAKNKGRNCMEVSE
ncbi:GGDEF domain-containing protein, partial [bacterium]|nr:GGDEF domain-containing protein [bacterium]